MFLGYLKDTLARLACLMGLVGTVDLMGLVGLVGLFSLVGLLGFVPKLTNIRYDAPNPRNDRNITMLTQKFFSPSQTSPVKEQKHALTQRQHTHTQIASVTPILSIAQEVTLV